MIKKPYVYSVICLGLLTLTSCMAPQDTSVLQDEKITDTFTFGLPSVDAKLHVEYFIDGKKIADMKCDAFVNGVRAEPSDGAVSLIRTWRTIYDEFHGNYHLESGPYMMLFEGKYNRVHPTATILRQIFGKWIIFKGDDMSRVHEVPSYFFPKVLVFNDGRVPADTYAPDIKVP